MPRDELVNGLGIAERVGVSKAAVGNWRLRYADFPQPLELPGVVGVPLWHWPTVSAWVASHRAE